MSERQPGGITQSPEGDPDVKLYWSNMNLPPAAMARAGVDTLRHTLDEISEGGVQVEGEVTLTRRLAADALLGRFRIPPGEPQPLDRLHLPWPQGLVRGTLHAPNPRAAVINAAALAIMPETPRSIRTVKRIGRQIGGPHGVPTIVYADLKDKNGKPIDYSEVGSRNAVQPSPEQLIGTGALDPKDPHGSYNYRRFHDSLWHRGIRGLITDNHHLTRAADRYPELYLDWEELLDDAKETGTNVMGAHASAGRVDSKHEVDRRLSLRELAAIFEGPDAIGETLMGQILARSYEIWRSQRERGILPQSRFRESGAVRMTLLERYTDDDGSLRWGDYFYSAAQDPIEAQFREENIYRKWLHGQLDGFPVTIEIPYGGMLAYRGLKRLRMPDLVGMHRDVAQSWSEYFNRLRQAYDSTHPARDTDINGPSKE